jgi:putative DNA primase/helicase
MVLQGKRLTPAQETKDGMQLNEALIKHLTGGDMITGRKLYQNFSMFRPTHKLLLSTNYKPRVLGTDTGIWRRVKLIDFKVLFEGERRDLQLSEKLQAEAPGILAWIVRGCTEWLKSGLRPPECVEIATQDYRSEQDVIGRFLKERCQLAKDHAEAAEALYKEFRKWAEESEDERMTQTAFGRELGSLRRGFTKDRGTGGRIVWKGLRLIKNENGLSGLRLRMNGSNSLKRN